MDENNNILIFSEAKESENWLNKQLRDSRNKIFTKTVKIDPILAELILENNDNNRPVSKRKVDEYGSDMITAKWAHNGETIKIATDGHLNDGQHRLLACIKYNVSFISEIVFGLTPESRTTVDIGVKRTVKHILAMTGHANSSCLAHASSLILLYKKTGVLKSIKDYHAGIRPTPPEIEEWVYKNLDVHRCVQLGTKLYSKFKISQGFLAAVVFLFYEISKEDTETFVEDLYEGKDLESNDPIWILREKLFEIGPKKLPEIQIAVFMIRSWNKFRSGISNGIRLVYRAADDFPKIE